MIERLINCKSHSYNDDYKNSHSSNNNNTNNTNNNNKEMYWIIK